MVDQSKKPIYDTEEPALPSTKTVVFASSSPDLIDNSTTATSLLRNTAAAEGENKVIPPQPSRLVEAIGKVRLWTEKRFTSAEDKISGYLSGYRKYERNATSTLSNLSPANEVPNLLPGTVYVLVGTLFGSILARNRRLPLRFITPIITGGLTFRLALPGTFNNTANLIWQTESKYAPPEIVDAQRQAGHSLQKAAEETSHVYDQALTSLDNTVTRSRKAFVDATGLRLPDPTSDAKNKVKNSSEKEK